jgi:hypothetical protein
VPGNLQHFRRLSCGGVVTVGLATTVAFAGVLSFASLVAGLATTLALAGILAFAGVLSGVIEIDGLMTGGDQLAAGLSPRGTCGSHRAAGGAGKQTAERGGGNCEFLVSLHDHVPFSFVIEFEVESFQLRTENKSVNHQRPGWPGDERMWPVHPSRVTSFPKIGAHGFASISDTAWSLLRIQNLRKRYFTTAIG